MKNLKIIERFYISPITEEYAYEFYDLIKEQENEHICNENHSKEKAAKRNKEAWNLFEAIQKQDLQAFVVIDRETNKSVCAATFYDCWTGNCNGLYLEDIVTTKNMRGNGIGHLAMAALAQITLYKGYKNLSWECAKDNINGHKFYDNFGSGYKQDKTTWRLFEPSFVPEGGCRNVFRILTNLEAQKYLNDSEFNPQKHDMTALVAFDSGLNPAAKLIAHRSFSTFRCVSGMHINSFEYDDLKTARNMLIKQIQMQAKNGCMGHVDITLSQKQQEPLELLLRDMGFEPLSFDNGIMVPRDLIGAALENAAKTKPYLIEDFIKHQRYLTEKNSDYSLDPVRPSENRSSNNDDNIPPPRL